MERGVFFADVEVASVSSHDSRQIEEQGVQPREDFLHGAEEHIELQGEFSVGSKCLGSFKGAQFLNDLIREKHVAGGLHKADGREEELDMCIRVEGFGGGTRAAGLQNDGTRALHAQTASERSVNGGA